MTDKEIISAWDRIETIISNKGFKTARDFCIYAKLSYSAYCTAKSANRLPSLNAMLTICELLNVSLDFIVRGIVTQTPETIEYSNDALIIAKCYMHSDNITKEMLKKLARLNN